MGSYVDPVTLLGSKKHRLTCRDYYKSEEGLDILVVVCDCGTVKDMNKKAFTSGQTKSCGCLQREHIRNYNATREVRVTHGMTKTVEYIAWRNMKARCDDKNHQVYERYGGRGISYDPRWRSFENFYEDMGDSGGLTLDRLDVNGDYSKDNCEWASRAQQSYNRRKTMLRGTASSTYKGVSFDKKSGKFKAAIRHNKKYIHLGYSVNDELLACRYDKALLELEGNSSGSNLALGLTNKVLDIDYPDDTFLYDKKIIKS